MCLCIFVKTIGGIKKVLTKLDLEIV